MKKLILVIAIFFSITASSQNLDTVSVSLTLRAQDWAWGIGKFGAGGDSASIAKVRQIRAALVAANPANWNTNVTVNNVPGRVLIFLYNSFVQAPFSEVLQMGNNTAERTTIYTNIRAVNNSALQYFIGAADGTFVNLFIETRNKGKNILLDN